MFALHVIHHGQETRGATQAAAQAKPVQHKIQMCSPIPVFVFEFIKSTPEPWIGVQLGDSELYLIALMRMNAGKVACTKYSRLNNKVVRIIRFLPGGFLPMKVTTPKMKQ